MTELNELIPTGSFIKAAGDGAHLRLGKKIGEGTPGRCYGRGTRDALHLPNLIVA